MACPAPRPAASITRAEATRLGRGVQSPVPPAESGGKLEARAGLSTPRSRICSGWGIGLPHRVHSGASIAQSPRTRHESAFVLPERLRIVRGPQDPWTTRRWAYKGCEGTPVTCWIPDDSSWNGAGRGAIFGRPRGAGDRRSGAPVVPDHPPRSREMDRERIHEWTRRRSAGRASRRAGARSRRVWRRQRSGGRDPTVAIRSRRPWTR